MLELFHESIDTHRDAGNRCCREMVGHRHLTWGCKVPAVIAIESQ